MTCTDKDIQSYISRSTNTHNPHADIAERDRLRPELIAENLHIGKVALDTILECKDDCADRLRKKLGVKN